LTDPSSPDFKCAGAEKITLAQVQADVFTPNCTSTCHVPKGSAPTDYSTMTATAANVGQASPYATPSVALKVVAANDLLDSVMWLKVLGGSPTYSGPPPSCVLVGAGMPYLLPPLDAGQRDEIKGWICNGAPAQ
jgi:hypothetical protein